jgi:hypothetical protein
MWFSFWVLACTVDVGVDSSSTEDFHRCAEVAERQSLWLESCEIAASSESLELDCAKLGAETQNCLVDCMEAEGCFRSVGRVGLSSVLDHPECDVECYARHRASR